MKYSNEDLRYKLVYNYFAHLDNPSQEDEFNNYMKEYAKWLKFEKKYNFDPSTFIANYFLLKKLDGIF